MVRRDGQSPQVVTQGQPAPAGSEGAYGGVASSEEDGWLPTPNDRTLDRRESREGALGPEQGGLGSRPACHRKEVCSSAEVPDTFGKYLAEECWPECVDVFEPYNHCVYDPPLPDDQPNADLCDEEMQQALKHISERPKCGFF